MAAAPIYRFQVHPNKIKAMLAPLIVPIMHLLALPAIALASSLEADQVLSLEATPESGRELFAGCTRCHGTEGWGAYSGDYPQIAGQHESVIIKQILDIQAGKRDNPAMLAAANELVELGPQAVADMAAYTSSLKMNPDTDWGDYEDEELREAADLYERICSACHGASGEGDADNFVPLLQGQNYSYLLRQLQRIQAGTRKNANPEMRELINNLSEQQLEKMANYLARLEPAEEKLAPYGWINPDFR